MDGLILSFGIKNTASITVGIHMFFEVSFSISSFHLDFLAAEIALRHMAQSKIPIYTILSFKPLRPPRHCG